MDFCSRSNLFGKDEGGEDAEPFEGMTWQTFRNFKHSVKKFVAKIRPSDFDPQGEFLTARSGSRKGKGGGGGRMRGHESKEARDCRRGKGEGGKRKRGEGYKEAVR